MTLQPFAQPPLSLALGAGRDLRGRPRGFAPNGSRLAPDGLRRFSWRCSGDAVAPTWCRPSKAISTPCSPTTPVPRGLAGSAGGAAVLASLNMQLYRRRREGEPGVLELAAGLLLVHAGGVHFLQCGAVGLLRYRQGSLQRLGGAASRWVAARSWRWSAQPDPGGRRALVAGAPAAARSGRPARPRRALCGAGHGAPGGRAAAVAACAGGGGAGLAGGARARPAAPRHTGWPALGAACPGDCVDGWTLQAACAFGPPGRLFRACDEQDARRCCCSRRSMPTKRSGSANGHCGAAVRRACREYCRRPGCVVMPSSCSLRRAGRCAACWIGRQRTCRWNRNARWSSWSNLSMRFAPCSGAAYRACGWRRGRSCWTRAGACCSSRGGGDPAGGGAPGAACGQRAAGAGVASRRGARWPGRPVRPGGAVLLAALWSLAVDRLPGERRRMPLRAPGRASGRPAGRLGWGIGAGPGAASGGRFEALSEFWLALQKPLAHPQRVFAPRRLQRGVLALVLLLAGAALLVGLAG